MTIENTDTPQLIPIREVSKLTGVNAVTLRAWERRYGLIKPHRTAKGHRLYSNEHITLIKQIVEWINRGVAVSKVKGLLEKQTTQPATIETPSTESTNNEQWLSYQEQISTAVQHFNETKLDDLCNQALAIYPINTVSNSLLLPILKALEKTWQHEYGSQAERIFFYQYLRNKLNIKLYHANKQATGDKLLLIAPPTEPTDIYLFFPALLAVSYNYQVQFFGPDLPINEISYITTKAHFDSVILVSHHSMSSLFKREIPQLLNSVQLPLAIIGEANIIHGKQFDSLGILHSTTLNKDFLSTLIDGRK
ncbi:MerR family transcriptional regulator [Endozoicomonas sp. SM1973]|uniref:MerR family transcriptional regulator n=1 Tax=Spartinivicinus marinus TaxID=2994442 RepID=A0A853I4V2_9GAMM|nr:MerR family transcriptional regulator [Spartinivicinus marinus]MCX4025017.1 MerR family transcriptional regulator [Spartinivicinus marinus]NYZ67709.1 MerR family transcriptional regulator [Spartinivicinus marinus]